jgi:hypothetical protein
VIATVPTAVLEVPTADPGSIRVADESGVLETSGATVRLTSGRHVVTASY